MTEEDRLIEKLRRIEALFARPGTQGEQMAAELARERIQARLNQAEREDPAVEYRFTLTDQWSRRLLMALLRRYGIDPYRYHGQRRTTVMARVSKRFVDEILWPEFEQLQQTMQDYFDEFTERVIAQALNASTSDVDEHRPKESGPKPIP